MEKNKKINRKNLLQKLLKEKEQILGTSNKESKVNKKKLNFMKRGNSLGNQNKIMNKKQKNNSLKNIKQFGDNLQQFFPIVKNYKILHKIGRGSFGEVFEGVHLPSKSKVAIKVYEKQNLTETRKKSIQSEIALLLKIENKFIVKFIDCFINNDRIFIIMELIEGENLFYHFRKNFDKIVSKNFSRQQLARLILYQLCQAINYLHKFNVNHRDIKLDNIVYNEKNKTIKLVDFGFSTVLKENSMEKVYCGTPMYLAPESVRKQYSFTLGIDIWAIGVVFYTIYFAKFPFVGKTDDELHFQILNKNLSKSKRILKCKQIDRFVFLSTMEKDHRKRIKANQLLQFVLNHFKQISK